MADEVNGRRRLPRWHWQIPFPGGYPGFFFGLFHGLIAPFALIGSLFTGGNVHEWPNSGAWNNSGFLLGGPPWLLGAIIMADR